MKYTVKYMEKMFHYVNEELFNNTLDMPTFVVLSTKDIKEFLFSCDNNLPDFDGICIPSHFFGDCHYFIGVWNKLDKNEFFNTFVHELIHVHCMEVKNYSKHGGMFRKWTKKATEVFYGTFETA